MKAFLRDLAFLGLFAASVAAVVLVVAIHQGRFTLDDGERESPGQAREHAALPASAEKESATESANATLAPLTDPLASQTLAAVLPAPAFDPTTRGAPGDARVLCLPEISWLQQQLSQWARESRDPQRRAPPNLQAAHEAARRASTFDYQVSPECWNDPATLESRGWGDCADKSLWLARELLRAGYTMVGIRLGVPEGYRPGQPGHAWVVLYHHGSEWIYDPAGTARLTSQDVGPTKRFRITATVFPR